MLPSWLPLLHRTNFDINVGGSGWCLAVPHVTMVGVTTTAELADQLKSNAAKLGISVNYDA